MPLFPAYQQKKECEEINNQDLSWLQNESCPPDISAANVSVTKDDGTLDSSLYSDSNSELEVDTKKEKEKNSEKKESYKYMKVSSKRSHSIEQSSRKKFKKYHKEKRKHSKFSKNKKSKKKKKHRKKHASSSSESDENDGAPAKDPQEDAFLSIPTFDGQNKDIFLHCPIQITNPREAFYFDRVPDKNNSIFCNTHFSQLANYFKLTSFPLGLDEYTNSTKKKRKKERRYFNSKSQLHQDSSMVASIISSDKDAKYIPLNLTYEEEKKLKESEHRSSAVNKLGIMDAATEAYLLGRTPAEKSVDKDINMNPERSYWQNQIKSFNERLNREPHNIALWLEFVDMQDNAIAHIFEWKKGADIKKGKNHKLLNERKISLLDSAIGKNIRCLELHLKRLDLGENIWELNKLKLEWDKLINNFPNVTNIWANYLIFHQTYFPIFHLNKIVQVYAKCLERFVQMQRGTFLSHTPPDNIGFTIVDLSTQLAYIWYQGGYMERSIALYQALIEMNLFSPSHLRRDDIEFSSKLDFFEAFWDSKAARFGEKGAIGWAKFMEKREPVIFPEEILEGKRDEEDDIIQQGGSKHDLWLRLESSRELNHWLPWQQDPDDCEDLERMVSFSVIKKHLFLTSSEDETFYMATSFLGFLGVSIPSCIMEDFPTSLCSVFFPLRLESLKCLRSRKELFRDSQFDFSVIGPSVHEMQPQSYFDFVVELVYRFIDLFSPKWRTKFIIILIRLFNERCSLLKRNNPNATMSLAKDFKERIKLFLKQGEYRSDLAIYYEYAWFETCVGRKKDALKTHAAALTLGLQCCPQDQPVEDLDEVLWRHLVSIINFELEVESFSQDNVNKILNLVCSVMHEKNFKLSPIPPNSALLLRIKKKINAMIEIVINQVTSSELSSLRKTNIFLYLLSILQMLTMGFKPACLVYENSIEKIDKTKYSKPENVNDSAVTDNKLRKFKETIYEYYLRVIEIAPKLSHIFPCLPMPPTSVRQILKAACEIAPNNLTFLEKSLQYQNWRDVLCGVIFNQRDKSDILVVAFRLLPHIKKVVDLMASTEDGIIGSGYQLENILESVVSGTGQNCPLLWRIYLRLIQVIKPNQIKQIAYRALNSCPNAKCLYMDCIELVPETMADILKLMEEKGIRIRLPLEELEILLEEESEMVENFDGDLNMTNLETNRRESFDVEDIEDNIDNEGMQIIK